MTQSMCGCSNETCLHLSLAAIENFMLHKRISGSNTLFLILHYPHNLVQNHAMVSLFSFFIQSLNTEEIVLGVRWELPQIQIELQSISPDY